MPVTLIPDEIAGGWDGEGVGSGSGPGFIPPQWLDINWSFTEGEPRGLLTGFEVGVVAGTVPDSDPWLVLPFLAAATERRAVRSVPVRVPLTTARCCVRCVFGAFRGPWAVQGVAQSIGNTTITVAPQTALDAITSDGILSRSEKPSVITEFKAAENDYLILSAKAEAASIGYSELASTWAALQDYITGLVPAYDATTEDTAINAATWQSTWQAFFRAVTSLMTKLASAPPGVVSGVAATNLNLTTNASQPTVDGVLRAAGDTLILKGQTTASENGLHQLGYAGPSGAAPPSWPAAGTPSGTGHYTSGAYAYDNSGSPNYTPNDATVALLTSSTGLGSETVIYSGWSGSYTTGQLKLNISTNCESFDDGETVRSGSVTVHYSKDGGTNWTLWDSFFYNGNGDHALSVDLTGVTASLLRVKVVATGAAITYWVDGTRFVELLTSYADIKSVYFAQPGVGSANWYFTKLREVPDGSVWSVTSGTTYGGKTYDAAVDGFNVITLTATTSYSQPFELSFNQVAKPTAAQKLLVLVVTRGLRVLATGHQGKTYVNPTATASLTLKKNGTSFGALQFSTSGVFSIPSVTQTDFAAGDVLTVEAPASQDSTFADFAVALKAQTL